jgi:hypothetical protein
MRNRGGGKDGASALKGAMQMRWAREGGKGKSEEWKRGNFQNWDGMNVKMS